MASRLELHEELCTLLGTRYVYFQPPESIKMKHPCIVYSIDGIDQKYADDKAYRSSNRYKVTTIDDDPDSDIARKILNHFSMCSFNRRYTSDNLNHDVLTLYY